MNTRILLTIGLLSILSAFCYGQSGFPYQAVLRDDIGSTINNREISIRFSIYQGDEASPVYQEEHETTTSASGQFAVEIGSGQSLLGDFQSIDWSHPSTSIQVEVNQGSGYTLMGRQELLSVPYAQYADLSGGLQNFTESGKNYQLTVDDLGNLQVVEIPEGYTKLVFQDEFNGTGLPDESKWGYEVGYLRNHEMQYYTEKRIENVFLEDGALHLRCINGDTIKNEQGEILNENITDDKKYYITSGSITTEGKHDWTYCRVEARLKVPLGSGTWSAIWMMPSENTYGYWPRSGEIDIMEYIGNTADKYNCATHFYSGDKGSNKSVENVEDWHIIAFEWHEDRMEWYIDGRMYYRTLNPNTNWGDWPFDQPFYLILNFAFGGGWGGQDGFDVGILPTDYQVDYVRIFQ